MKSSNLVHIGAAIKSLIAESPLHERLLQYQIKTEWPSLAGPLIANNTKRLWFVRQTLYIELHSDVLKHELQYHRGQLINTINLKLNQVYVQDLKIV